MTPDEKRLLILEECRGIQIEKIPNLLFSYEAPESEWIHSMPRLNLLLSGECAFNCFDAGHFHTELLSAPAIYYCAWTGYQMRKFSGPCRALSFCYFPGYIRLVLVDYDGVHEPPTDRDLFYHSSLPLSPGGFQLIRSIDLLYREGETQSARRLLDELFVLTVQKLAVATALPAALPPRVWDEINTYLRSHREENISRARIARLFGISPGYVSRLARRYADTDFVALVVGYQLEHAALLLRKSRLSIDEIADRSGFRYLSYFYRRFKQRYGVTPRAYRENCRDAAEENGVEGDGK